MMKIEKLEIKNFRGIHHLVLDFHEQTNILVGVNGCRFSNYLDRNFLIKLKNKDCFQIKLNGADL